MNPQARGLIFYLAVMALLIAGSMFFRGIGNGPHGGLIITGALVLLSLSFIGMVLRQGK